ncbi:MAG: PQQ-like beta-propeller repeat protein [Mariniblastus sp.]|nr:PQQ-like beta-propeller repeat protein [Mariniblastus sp.]
MDNETARRRGRFPLKLVLWTLFVAALLCFLNARFEWLNDRFNLDMGVVRIGSFVLCGLTFVLWWVWLTFLSGGSRRLRLLLGGAVILLVGLFFLFNKRVLDGDMGFVRFEPRLWSLGEKPIEVEANGSQPGVDLVTTREFDFPQFLGPQRNGVISGRQLKHDWEANPPREVWKHPVGLGWSGVVAVNQHAITQEQRGADECVTCYDLLTGKLLWINRIATRHEDTMGLGRVGPRATLAVDEGRVYAQGATGWLQCLDGKDGSVIWKVFLPDLLGIEMITARNLEGFEYTYEDSPLAWGRSSAPLIFQDKVIVAAGGPTGGPFQTLIAFDKKTGKKIWSGGDSMISYGSPSVAQLAGGPQIVVMAEAKGMGFDPQDGRTLWWYHRSGSTNGDANCSQVTVVSDDQLLMSKGYAKGGELVQLTPEGDSFKVERVWKNKRVLKTKFANPVILSGFAYSLSDGFLECTELATGKQQWKKRGRFGHGQLLLVGDDLLVQSEHGRLYLVAASPEGYQARGEVKTIDGICWNTFCLAGDYLVVRSETEMACFELAFEPTGDEPLADAESGDGG